MPADRSGAHLRGSDGLRAARRAGAGRYLGMNTVDVGSALDDAQWRGYQKLLVFATAMTIILDGLDNQLLGAALPALMREWHLPRPAFVPVQTSGMVGMMVGGAIGGIIGER